MAVRITRDVIDDMTGEVGAETVTFAFQGTTYEIDLVSDAALSEALAPYIDAARVKRGHRAKQPKPKSTSSKSTSSNGKATETQVRQWAQSHDLDVPARGRMPVRFRTAYEANDPALAAK